MPFRMSMMVKLPPKTHLYWENLTFQKVSNMSRGPPLSQCNAMPKRINVSLGRSSLTSNSKIVGIFRSISFKNLNWMHLM